ncbi:MAG: adenylate/guanylate cyclase domain-containing protein [Actinobacteria bacterium]|nr:adenylate/guanylate cyclase domain-containing protein [Actinomycetota bacterium]
MAFVDLAGFTAMTEAHGDEYAADVYEAFAGVLARSCSSTGGEVRCVKHLGDGALLVAESGASLVSALLDGVRDQGDAEMCLLVRAGVHAGTVLQVETVHGQDYLGHTVNVAARLCGRAAPGELVLSGPVRDGGGLELPEPPRPLGALALRHVAVPVPAWAASRRHATTSPAATASRPAPAASRAPSPGGCGGA